MGAPSLTTHGLFCSFLLHHSTLNCRYPIILVWYFYSIHAVFCTCCVQFSQTSYLSSQNFRRYLHVHFIYFTTLTNMCYNKSSLCICSCPVFCLYVVRFGVPWKPRAADHRLRTRGSINLLPQAPPPPDGGSGHPDHPERLQPHWKRGEWDDPRYIPSTLTSSSDFMLMRSCDLWLLCCSSEWIFLNMEH